MSKTKNIRLTGPTLPMIRDTSTPLPRVTPEMIVTSLGAEVEKSKGYIARAEGQARGSLSGPNSDPFKLEAV